MENSEQKQTDTWTESQIFGGGLGVGGRFLQVFSAWEEIGLVLYPVHVFFTNVLALSKYNHP